MEYRTESNFKLNVDRTAQLIAAHGLKKYWVAEQIGIHKTTLHRWFSGQIHFIRKRNLDRLAGVLLTNASDLITTNSNRRAA